MHLFKQRHSLRALTLYFGVVAVLCLWLADINISVKSPGHELWLMAKGIANPHIPKIGRAHV